MDKRMRNISELPFIDYQDAAYAKAPFRWLAERAAEHKIARSERGVEILDYNMCRGMLLDRALGTDHGNLVERMGLPEGRALEFKRRTILTQNRGDTRKRLRSALTGLIGPSQAAQMRKEFRGVIDALIDDLPDGPFDLKYAVADLVPAGVYCHWVKAPIGDARFVSDMSETVLKIFRRDPSLTPEIVAAYDKLFAYAKDKIAARRLDLSDDFISRLIRVQEAGDLSEDELEDFVVMLIEASTDNTAHQTAIAVERLCAMPNVWRAIGKDPSLVDGAVREVMRLWPRSISTSRTALWDTEFADVAIPKGTSMFASFGAAHRQADIFDDPHNFKMDRAERPMHMNFGGGAFSCLGQFVASIEVSEAVSALAQRFPNLTIENSEKDYSPMFQMISRLDVKPNN
jgi:cytochrome P450